MLDLRLNITQPTNLNVSAQTSARVTAILGTSASGKTSLLRIIAGLNKSAQGQILWRDRSISNLAPHQRPFAMVQQEPALFPHWNLQQHIDQVRRHALGSSLNARQLTQAFGLNEQLNKLPQELSGGQQQRAALLLALLREPQLLLLDEPFSALDHSAKQQLFPVLLQTLKTLNAQALLISHQLRDCAALADRAWRLENKTIEHTEAIGAALRRYQGNVHLHSLLDATFVENQSDSRLAHFKVGQQSLFAFNDNTSSLSPGDNVRLAIYADDIGISLSKPTDSSFVNILEARITQVRPSEHGHWVHCALSAQDVVVEVSQRSQEKLFLSPKKSVHLLAKAGAIDVLGPHTPQ